LLSRQEFKEERILTIVIHRPQLRHREIIDDKKYEVSNFTGDGKLYDKIREPHNPKRVGGFLYQGICPILEQVVEFNRAKLTVQSVPVEIRPPLISEIELVLAEESKVAAATVGNLVS
jgi:hypothetical protein